MGDVHLARRDGSEGVCVLKVQRKEQRQNAAQLARMKREALVLSYLDHPNVARILDAGVEQGVFYLALEYIDGFTLRNAMRKWELRGRPMPPGAALAIGLAVLDGLAHAHSLKGPEGEKLDVVHRDLSPNNIMVTATGQVKIIDFGLAAAKVDHFHTMPGFVLGTLRYAPPEQCETGQVDQRGDIYTLGAVLYEMLTGHPVVGTRDPKDVLQAVLKAQPRPFREVAPNLPEALWAVFQSVLSKNPEQRPQSARLFADRLREGAKEVVVFAPPQVGQMIATLFAPEKDTATTLDNAPDTLIADTTASEPRKTLVPSPRATQVRSRVPWFVAAAVCSLVMPLSFGVVKFALERKRPPIAAEAPVPRDAYERQVRRLLEERRHEEASDAIRGRAEDMLETGEAMEIQRALYDAEPEDVARILERQLELERRRR
jgi:eukaryotic-like serine/threonine-protein kinase